MLLALKKMSWRVWVFWLFLVFYFMDFCSTWHLALTFGSLDDYWHCVLWILFCYLLFCFGLCCAKWWSRKVWVLFLFFLCSGFILESLSYSGFIILVMFCYHEKGTLYFVFLSSCLSLIRWDRRLFCWTWIFEFKYAIHILGFPYFPIWIHFWFTNHHFFSFLFFP